jgi:hypothetical protein
MTGSRIFRSPLRRWLSVSGIVLGAVLVQLTFAASAHAGDLGFPYGGYGPGYPIGGYGYGCGSHCGCVQPCGCGVSCYPPVIERRFVVRSYYERRLPYCCGYGGYGGGGYGYGGFGGYGGYRGYGGGYYPSAYGDGGYGYDGY